MLSRLLALLDGGARLQLEASAPLWAQRVVTEGLAADTNIRPSFDTILTWLEDEAPVSEVAEDVL
jgi:hypothetical protein